MQHHGQHQLTVEPQLPLPLGEVALQSNDGEGEDADRELYSSGKIFKLKSSR